MAIQEQLYTALRNADAAGDVEGARKLAAYIQQSMSATAAPAAVPIAAPEQTAPKGMLSKIGGALEAGANIATGGVAALGGGLNYLGTLAASGGDTDAAKAVQEDTQQALTYQPRSEAGKRYAENAGTALSYLGQKEGEYLGEKSSELASKLGASPEVAGTIGSALNTGTQAIPQLLGLRALKGAKAAVKPASVAAEVGADISKPKQITEARSMGYKLPPRMAGGKIGSIAEGVAGSAKLERTLSVKNQSVTNKLAREEIGLKGDKPISGAELDMLRKKHNAAYDQISKSGRITADETFAREMFGVGGRTAQVMKDFPEAASGAIEKLRNAYLQPEFDASSAVQATRKLRADAKKLMKAFDDPEKQALGLASREIADAFDGALQRHAESIGKPKLAEDFRTARTQLAKIHSVEDALNESTGHVSALTLGKALDRGVPLSGNLLKIAQTARRFGKAVQDVDKLPARSVGFEDLFVGGAGGIAGGSLGALDPITGGAALLARPGIRNVLASDLYQGGLGEAGALRRQQFRQTGAAGVRAGAIGNQRNTLAELMR